MTIFIYIAVSLDNFIATPDGGLDWLYAIPNPEQSDYGFADFIQRVDALVMGREDVRNRPVLRSLALSETRLCPKPHACRFARKGDWKGRIDRWRAR